MKAIPGLLALPLVGLFAALLMALASASPQPPQKLRPTKELVGEVTTVVPGANPQVDRILAEADAK